MENLNNHYESIEQARADAEKEFVEVFAAWAKKTGMVQEIMLTVGSDGRSDIVLPDFMVELATIAQTLTTAASFLLERLEDN